MEPPSGPVADVNTNAAMAAAVVTTFFCCLPLGVGAIILASQAANAKQNGDLETARQKARTAYVLCGIAGALGLLSVVGYVMLFVLGFVASATP